MNILKFGLAGLVGVLALTLFATTQPAERAHADPLAVVALNNGNCVALGSAFAGLAATDAFLNCEDLDTQTKFQTYVHCIRGFDVENDGTKECLNSGFVDGPSDPGFPLNAPVNIQADPSDFTALDIDANQIHLGVKYRIIAFVDDDFPVRFTADKGEFLDQAGLSTGRNLQCENAIAGVGDPDCDSDSATEGDGVVVATFRLTPEDGDSGVVHINVIQEGIGFPVELNIVGPAESITLTPLFGRDTIQTGATKATPGKCAGAGFCQNADYTDCNFAATVDGVLGANNTAEKGVIVAKVLDNDGNEVIGSLIDWNHGFELLVDETTGEPLPPPDPTDPDTKNFGPTPQGGVALPQTPTIDMGAALGFGFPQFVCGGDTPGDLVLKATLNGVYDDLTPHGLVANAEVTIHVVGPAVDVSLKADPPELDCNGTNTTTITATFATATGDPTADGLDANFSVVALGTVNPLTTNTSKGVASTVLTPLSGAGGLTADGGPAGVIVTVHANGQIHTIFGAPRIGPHSTWDPVDGSILVRCTGGPPPPGTGTLPPEGAAPGGDSAGAGAGPTGRIAGPDTGSAGMAGGDALTAWPALALLAAAMMLGGAALAVRRTR